MGTRSGVGGRIGWGIGDVVEVWVDEVRDLVILRRVSRAPVVLLEPGKGEERGAGADREKGGGG